MKLNHFSPRRWAGPKEAVVRWRFKPPVHDEHITHLPDSAGWSLAAANSVWRICARTGGGVEEHCSVCQVDVSLSKRVKDAQGRYYCPACWQAGATPPPPRGMISGRPGDLDGQSNRRPSPPPGTGGLRSNLAGVEDAVVARNRMICSAFSTI